jgi:hypothetical protein
MIIALRPFTDILAWPDTAGFHPMFCKGGWEAWLEEIHFDELCQKCDGMMIHGIAGWHRPSEFHSGGRDVAGRAVPCQVLTPAQAMRSKEVPPHWSEGLVAHLGPRAHYWATHGKPIYAHCGVVPIDDDSDPSETYTLLRQANLIPCLDTGGEIVAGGDATNKALDPFKEYILEPRPLSTPQLVRYSGTFSDTTRLETGARGGHHMIYLPGPVDPNKRFGIAMEWASKEYAACVSVWPDTGVDLGEGGNLSEAMLEKLR